MFDKNRRMRIKVYILVVLALALFVMPGAARAHQADSAHSREYQIKTAFLYNFIKFVDWPKEKIGNGNEPIIIGIIGEHPSEEALGTIKSKKVKGKNIVVKQFESFEELKKSGGNDKAELAGKIEALTKCHLLFICSSEEEYLKEIINSVKDHSVLTVGEVKGFLEAGGIINFLMEEKKIRFEVNIDAARQAELEIRSKLLRLAKRVVEEDTARKKQK
jgi:hypothetical protein